ncbi:hypothetical protein EJ08DRAFT_650645 [Tothia fuscella]|uniref:Uncharacterized protein n=1 Tax=Tothia fuscella TaxID=1048955 RepID=A0A9P4NQ14_9PEZI|nr:hypothetical protein EJ08DRAFT_650645 [Tothia fuscella]
MSAVPALISSLFDGVAGPVNNSLGETRVGDYSAGTSSSSPKELVEQSTSDKAGAGVLSMPSDSRSRVVDISRRFVSILSLGLSV